MRLLLRLRGAAGPDVSPGPAIRVPSSWEWPFVRHVTPVDGATAGEVWIPDLTRAFPAHQVPGTRLVLTQSTYQMQRWLDWVDCRGRVTVTAGADRDALARVAPEALVGRGPWRRIVIEDDDGASPPVGDKDDRVSAVHAAFCQPSPETRLAACRDALANDPDNAALHLACASTLMELQRLDDAHEALQGAVAMAPDWEAAHFEQGKLWLRAEETERAAAAFAEAGRLMPTFSAAFGNLGAALGELDRGNEALEALRQALAHDPDGYPIVNNLGAVYRDMGRLADAEAAFTRVTHLQPAFVFGFYNLAHTLFLAGRFAEARDAYAEGMRRDSQKNARQACRLAMARAAAGDATGAIADLEAVAERVPADVMRDLMEEAESTLRALSAIGAADAAGLARVLERVRAYSS